MAPAAPPPARPPPRPPGAADPPPAAAEKAGRAINVRAVLGVAILVIFVVFVVQNSDEVPVTFLWMEARVPLVFVFVACALIGALVTYLLGRPGRRAQKKYIQELERRLGERKG